MYPRWFPWFGDANITHSAFVALAFFVGLSIFVRDMQKSNRTDTSAYAPILIGIMLGGLIGARIGSFITILASRAPNALFTAWEYGGKSVLGGLAGAYIGAVIAKRIVGFAGSTGNDFAPAVAAAMAVGRIGCFLTEPPGRPTSLPWAISIDPRAAKDMPDCTPCQLGQRMHPSIAYEILFLVLSYFAMRRWGHRFSVPGSLFVAFLTVYAFFRFFVEFTRANPLNSWGLSGSQTFLLFVFPLLVWRLITALRSNSAPGAQATNA